MRTWEDYETFLIICNSVIFSVHLYELDCFAKYFQCQKHLDAFTDRYVRICISMK